MSITSALSHIPRAALARLRSRPGARTVIMSPDGARGGNLLYHWAWAHTLNQRHGAGTAIVERNRHVGPWLEEFPDLLPLTLDARGPRLLDRRHATSLMYYDDPMGGADLAAFVTDRLLPSARFQERLAWAREAMGDDALVLNIRRGDYYTNPDFQRRYDLDAHEHVRQALSLLGHAPGARPAAAIVSDDVPWSKEHLSDLATLMPLTPPGHASMFNDLAALATASTLVLANSTFSYWGQFISRSVSGTQRAIAPAAHEYYPDTGQVVDLLFDPAWDRTNVRPGRPDLAA